MTNQIKSQLAEAVARRVAMQAKLGAARRDNADLRTRLGAVIARKNEVANLRFRIAAEVEKAAAIEAELAREDWTMYA